MLLYEGGFCMKAFELSSSFSLNLQSSNKVLCESLHHSEPNSVNTLWIFSSCTKFEPSDENRSEIAMHLNTHVEGWKASSLIWMGSMKMKRQFIQGDTASFAPICKHLLVWLLYRTVCKCVTKWFKFKTILLIIYGLFLNDYFNCCWNTASVTKSRGYSH